MKELSSERISHYFLRDAARSMGPSLAVTIHFKQSTNSRNTTTLAVSNFRRVKSAPCTAVAASSE